jgi:hypothetical protein
MVSRSRDSEPAGAPEASIDRFLTVVYDTEAFGASHTVTVRDSLNGWEDRPMERVEVGGHTQWSANLRSPSDMGPVGVEFKLVLDGDRWMAGPNKSATTGESPTVVVLDDSSVVWE